MSVEDKRMAGEELWRLIEQRAKNRDEADSIDRRIWERFGARCAVMFTDLSGFSRRVEAFGIVHFLQVIYEHHQLVRPIAEAHLGTIVKKESDSLLLVFQEPESALAAAIEMQRACKLANANRRPEDEILLCIGIGFGEVLRVGSHDVFGAQVNAASKLGEDTARAWEILVTGELAEHCQHVAGVSYEPIDEVPPGAGSACRVRYHL